jgi:hypothetical protein
MISKKYSLHFKCMKNLSSIPMWQKMKIFSKINVNTKMHKIFMTDYAFLSQSYLRKRGTG